MAPDTDGFDPLWPVKQVIRERDDALERIKKLEYDLERTHHDLASSETMRRLESVTLQGVCRVLRRERDEARERIAREPRVSDAIRKDRDEAIDQIAYWQKDAEYWQNKAIENCKRLEHAYERINDLSQARVKVQVKWGADVDRLNTMLEGLCEIIKALPKNRVVRHELERLVKRIEDDLKRYPRMDNNA